MAPLTGRLAADFSSFYGAVTEAEAKLTSFASGASRVEGALQRMTDSFSGKKVIQDATLMVQAVENLGGVSKLTEDELKRLQTTLEAATEKGKALGIELPESFQKMATEASKAQTSFRDIATAIAGISGAVGALALGIGELGARGADVADMREQFTLLTAQIGLSADALTTDLKAATLGTVSDFELMKTVNQGLSQGLQLTAEQFTKTGDLAAVLADRVGGDTAQAFDALVQAMATGQDKQLKQIGLNIDAAAAYDIYATSIGKATKDLTEQERKQATVNAIMQEAEAVLTASGKAQADFADKTAQTQVRLKDFVDGIAEWVGSHPEIATWTSGITTAAGAITSLGTVAGPVMTAVGKTEIWGAASRGLGAMGISAASAGATMGVLGLAIAGVWAAWELGKTDTVSDTIGEWVSTSMLAEAQLLRWAFSIEKVTAEQYKANVASMKAGQAAIARAEQEKKQAAAMEEYNRRLTEANAKAEEARAAQERIAQAKERARAAEQAHKEAIAAATKEMERQNKEVERQQKALEGLGFTTKTSVNAALNEMAVMQLRATSEGIALDKVLVAQLPHLNALAVAAKKSGIEVEGLAAAQRAAYEAFFRTNPAIQDTVQGYVDLSTVMPLTTDEAARLNAIMSPDQWNAHEATEAMQRMGITSRAELQSIADQAERDYARIVATVGAHTPEAEAAFRKMIEAQKAASGELPTYWETNILPALQEAFANISTAMSDTFAGMLTGAVGFKDGFVSIWESIKQSLRSILAEILDYFTTSFLKGMLGSLLGHQGAFGAAFAGLFGGGGSGGIGNLLGGLLGGGGGIGAGIADLAPNIATSAGLANALGLGGGAAGAGAGAGGGLMGSLGGLLTNPWTAGVAGALALGLGIWKGGLFRGGEEALKVNPARDEFFRRYQDQFGGSQFEALAKAFGAAGVSGDIAERQIAALYAADTMKEFDAATAAITESLAKQQVQQEGSTVAVTGFQEALSDAQTALTTWTQQLLEPPPEGRGMAITFGPGAIVVDGVGRNAREISEMIAPSLVDLILRENPAGTRTMLRRGLVE